MTAFKSEAFYSRYKEVKPGMTEVGPDHLLRTAASVVLVPATKVRDAHTLVKGQ